jgi:hypothetical protein
MFYIQRLQRLLVLLIVRIFGFKKVVRSCLVFRSLFFSPEYAKLDVRAVKLLLLSSIVDALPLRALLGDRRRVGSIRLGRRGWIALLQLLVAAAIL